MIEFIIILTIIAQYVSHKIGLVLELSNPLLPIIRPQGLCSFD